MSTAIVLTGLATSQFPVFIWVAGRGLRRPGAKSYLPPLAGGLRGGFYSDPALCPPRVNGEGAGDQNQGIAKPQPRAPDLALCDSE